MAVLHGVQDPVPLRLTAADLDRSRDRWVDHIGPQEGQLQLLHPGPEEHPPLQDWLLAHSIRRRRPRRACSSELLTDEKKETEPASGGANTYFNSVGIIVKRALNDNEACYRAKVFAAALGEKEAAKAAVITEHLHAQLSEEESRAPVAETIEKTVPAGDGING